MEPDTRGPEAAQRAPTLTSRAGRDKGNASLFPQAFAPRGVRPPRLAADLAMKMCPLAGIDRRGKSEPTLLTLMHTNRMANGMGSGSGHR